MSDEIDSQRLPTLWDTLPNATASLPPGLPKYPPHNLLASLTSFVGREQEMAEVRRLLKTTRLLTLTGPGGCGKTRLALRVAEDLLASGEYPDGLWWVELAGVAEPALVPQTVASSLAVREQPGRLLSATLSDSMRSKKLLLILDNCEHVVETCAHLAGELLSACPSLRILATSREALRIPGETTWLVPSLSLPLAFRFPTVPELARYDAVRLFVDRAKAVLPDFAITSPNALAVAQVCFRLDGIPLAIELAAARVNILSVAQIAERLDRALSLLTRGSPMAVPRHQTLRATLDWSYELLSPQGQALLRRLSVFVGGFTLEASEAVCAGEGIEAEAILDVLSELVDKSLVVVERQVTGSRRCRLLEIIRQYSQEKLGCAGEMAIVSERHARWYLELAERAAPELRKTDSAVWLDRLETEHDNLRAAFRWLLEAGEVETALQVSGQLHAFWWRRGYTNERRAWLEAAMVRRPLSAPVRAAALNEAGYLARDHGDNAQAKIYLEESLALFQELGDKLGSSRALYNIGMLAMLQTDYKQANASLSLSLSLAREAGSNMRIQTALIALSGIALLQGDYAQARVLAEEGLRLAREAGDKVIITEALGALGEALAAEGDYGRASSLLEEGLALSREEGSVTSIGDALDYLGAVYRDRGDYPAARSFFEQSIAIFTETGDSWRLARSLAALAYVAYQLSDHALARALFQESLPSFRKLDDRRSIAEYAVVFAGIARSQRQMEWAAQLLAAAQALLETTNACLLPPLRAEFTSNLAAARAGSSEAAFATAWAEGRTMRVEQIVDYALALLNPTAPAIELEEVTPPVRPLSPRQAAKQQFGGLTAREREVAVLIAQGKTNVEIAGALVTSKRTVEKHVSSILAKLDFHSRAQIVAWIIEKGLSRQIV